MSKDTHRYTKDNLTVIWKPGLCIHSTICWKGMIRVFNPKARPWVNMEGSTPESIMEQVQKCPSGALSYELNEAPVDDGTAAAAPASASHIEILKNGPILVKTECRIKHSDGSEETKSGVTALCRCGASANKPYCDGSHTSSGFEG